MKIFVSEILPFATCQIRVTLIFDILKQIQIRLLIESKQIFFGLILFDLDYMDLFICYYING